MGIASVQKDWFRSLACGLTLCRVVQEVTYNLPEDCAIGVALLEVKGSWTCTVIDYP